MPSKNDLSSIKAEPKNTLIKTPKPASKQTKRRVGRPPKPVKEKESELLGLRFTPSEFMVLKEKAGLVPLATFVKDHIRRNTDLLG